METPVDSSGSTVKRRALVMGAGGNVGACVTRHLVARGDDVRVLIRPSSDTRGIDGLAVQRCYGDIFDADAVATAMDDREDVYYCVVDTRAELRDPTPLFKTNVDGLRRVLKAAVSAQLRRFVYLSTIGTIAIGRNGETVDETTPFNWADEGGAYIAARREGEALVLGYARDNGLPAVVACVSNPYGPPDWQPRQGALVQMAALGKLPFYVRGIGNEVVAIDDAAEAMLLAAERGRVGERYIISERFMTQREMVTIATHATGATPCRIGIPVWLLRVLGRLIDVAAWASRRDLPLNSTGVRLMVRTSPADHSKATRELDWHPGPTETAIRDAARSYVEREIQQRGEAPTPARATEAGLLLRETDRQ